MKNIDFFVKNVLKYYDTVDRNMPWKATQDPYKIWVSEVILQQTRVAQGRDYYIRFIEKFPDVKSLAQAELSDVLHVWQGLGYYSRARNMYAAAQQVMTDFNGIFPSQYDQLLTLKGVGKYTAAAVSSFAINQDQAVVDGNVIRVLSRYFGIYDDMSLSSNHRKMQTLAQQLLPKHQSAIYNQAIMDFGALICTPSAKCDACFLQKNCIAFQKNEIALLPIKNKKLKIKERYFFFIKIMYKNEIMIHHRAQKGIWQGLHTYPIVEKNENIIEVRKSLSIHFSDFEIQDISDQIIYKLTHQTLYCQLISIKVESKKMVISDLGIWIKKEDTHQYAMPQIMNIL